MRYLVRALPSLFGPTFICEFETPVRYACERQVLSTEQKRDAFVVPLKVTDQEYYWHGRRIWRRFRFARLKSKDLDRNSGPITTCIAAK